jgi:ClpP class serine protease
MVQSLIDETYGQFTNVVRAGRGAAHGLNKDEGRKLADNWKDFADGRVVSGSQALAHGLRGRAGQFRRRRGAHGKKSPALKNSNLVEYRERYDLSNFLSMFGQSGQSHDIKLQLGAKRPSCGRLDVFSLPALKSRT